MHFCKKLHDFAAYFAVVNKYSQRIRLSEGHGAIWSNFYFVVFVLLSSFQ